MHFLHTFVSVINWKHNYLINWLLFERLESNLKCTLLSTKIRIENTARFDQLKS